MAGNALVLAAGVIWCAKEVFSALTLKSASLNGREATSYFRTAAWFSAGFGGAMAIEAAFGLGAGL